MNREMTLAEWLAARKINPEEMAKQARIDDRVLQAILECRYTTSPKIRQRIADVLQTTPEEICWGQSPEVDQMYGHGPQFGRSP